MLAAQPAKTSVPEMESQNKLQGIIVKQAAQEFGSKIFENVFVFRWSSDCDSFYLHSFSFSYFVTAAPPLSSLSDC